MELDLLDRGTWEGLLRSAAPDLVIASDCLYDLELARAAGEALGAAAAAAARGGRGCAVLAADPGRLDGRGRTAFLEGFRSEPRGAGMAAADLPKLEDAEVPQEALRACGASLAWFGAGETRVGVFFWPGL